MLLVLNSLTLGGYIRGTTGTIDGLSQRRAAQAPETQGMSSRCRIAGMFCLVGFFAIGVIPKQSLRCQVHSELKWQDMPSLPVLDLSEAPFDVVRLLIETMDLQQRFTCALVCSEWANAVAAVATPAIVKHAMRTFTRLQEWLDKNGSQVDTLQLQGSGVIARLPCAQLQNLLLHGVSQDAKLILGSGVWRDIAAASKLTSVQLVVVITLAEQADVVSALTALPDLQQLTWRDAVCVVEGELLDSRLLQQLTRLTSLKLGSVAAEALQHLSLLTKLQHLSMHLPPEWAAADYPGLQELQGLTHLVLRGSLWCSGRRFPACVSRLTALQQLEVVWATFPELNALTALTALTKLHVANLSPTPTVLLLPTLQHLRLKGGIDGFLPLLHTSHLASCTQLRFLSLCFFSLAQGPAGPGSLVASSMLQELEVWHCSLSSGEGVHAAILPWEVLPPGPGRLPHLTSLVLRYLSSEPQQPDVERQVACCSGLRALHLQSVNDEQCRSLAQLTRLQDLQVSNPRILSTAGLRHLACLEQLTSLKFTYDFDWHKVSTVLLEQLSDKVPGYRHAMVNKVGAGCISHCGHVPWWWTALVVFQANKIYAAVSHTYLPTRGVTCSHTAGRHADLLKPAITHSASIILVSR